VASQNMEGSHIFEPSQKRWSIAVRNKGCIEAFNVEGEKKYGPCVLCGRNVGSGGKKVSQGIPGNTAMEEDATFPPPWYERRKGLQGKG